MTSTIRKLLALVTVARSKLVAVREFYARAAYPNFGLGSIARNAPTLMGGISREPSDWWRSN